MNTEINKNVVPSFEEFLYNEQSLLTMVCEHYADNDAEQFKSETLHETYENIINFVHGVKQIPKPVHEFLAQDIEKVEHTVINLNNDVYESERIDRIALSNIATQLRLLAENIDNYISATKD
jgi:hypothetical protein